MLGAAGEDAMTSPCMDCPDRTAVCHANCEHYKAYADRREEVRLARMETVKQSEFYKGLREHRYHEIFDNHRSAKRIRKGGKNGRAAKN